MEFLELAAKRYSVRKFKDKEIPREDVKKILRAGQIAPTAHNAQPQKIFVLQSKEALEKWDRCSVHHFGEKLVIITCADLDTCWKREYDGKKSGDVDASIITTHMMLEATELGIGSCWIMHFIPDAVRKEFELPENLEPISVLAMGYPAEGSVPTPSHDKNKPLSETVICL